MSDTLCMCSFKGCHPILGSILTSKLSRLIVCITVLYFCFLLYISFTDSDKLEMSKPRPLPLLDIKSSQTVQPNFVITSTLGENGIKPSSVQDILKGSEEVWKRYVVKRKHIVGNSPDQINPWPSQTVLYYWDYFLPSFTCPHLIERIGRLGDGGKWICGLELFEQTKLNKKALKNPKKPLKQKVPECVMYSFGISYEYSFEMEMLKRVKTCELFAYDASVDGLNEHTLESADEQRIHFQKRYIGANDTNEVSTLKTLMKQNGHEWIDFFKMDVEGGEFLVLDQIMDDFEIFPFSQMQLEIHGDEEGKNFAKLYKIWERMEEKGLRAFKNEMNHWPCVRAHLNPIYAEYSFINTKGKLNKLIM